ncbi:MAG: superoxide dismutase [Alphaproteobacteria bacterium]|nr:MAG: superoxide dismutase [Alphaproteobacteria bacterium]
MTITLPDLPYAQDALEPHISAKTLKFHHGKHHQAYVTKTNELVAGTALEGKTLDEIVVAAHRQQDAKLFNQAAQVWNHTFYWKSMSPQGGGKPAGDLLAMIEASFGDFETFKSEFKTAAAGQFGSGWAWLVLDRDKLAITTTSNADTPLVHDVTPLLTVDVWEHAYYLDYQNARPDYLDTFLDKLVNWEFAAQNLAKARQAQAAR